MAQLNFYSGGATPTGVAVTWNGVSLTQIGTEGTAFLFGLVNPASGNHALVATWTGGSLYAALNGTSFTNCAQTGTFINVNTATGSSPPTSLAITNPSGNIAIDSVASTEPLSSPSQTQLFVDNTNSYSGSSYSAGVNPTFSWSSPCSAATNYLARTSGGNEGGNAANITALVCGLVADGVITGNLSGATGGCGSYLDAFYIGAQQNSGDASLNLCGTSYGLTLNGGTFTSYTGWSAYGSTGINTGFNPATASSPNFTQNSASLGFWAEATVTETTPQIGQGSASSGMSMIYDQYTGSTFYARVNNGSSGSVPTPGTKGLFVGDRSSSASSVPYWDGVAQSSVSASSQAIYSGNFFLGTIPFGGSTSAQTICEAHFGASLGATLELALYNRLRTYMTAVGVP